MSNKQIIDDAITDAGTISKVTEGNTDIQVTSRTGKKIWTLSTLSRMIEQGFYRMFSTTAILMAYRPEYSPFAAKALDTKKVYVWESNKWVDTGLSELDLAKDFVVESAVTNMGVVADVSLQSLPSVGAWYVNGATDWPDGFDGAKSFILINRKVGPHFVQNLINRNNVSQEWIQINAAGWVAKPTIKEVTDVVNLTNDINLKSLNNKGVIDQNSGVSSITDVKTVGAYYVRRVPEIAGFPDDFIDALGGVLTVTQGQNYTCYKLTARTNPHIKWEQIGTGGWKKTDVVTQAKEQVPLLAVTNLGTKDKIEITKNGDLGAAYITNAQELPDDFLSPQKAVLLRNEKFGAHTVKFLQDRYRPEHIWYQLNNTGFVKLLTKPTRNSFLSYTQFDDKYKEFNVVKLTKQLSDIDKYIQDTPTKDVLAAGDPLQTLILLYDELVLSFPEYVSKKSLGKDATGLDIFEYTFSPVFVGKNVSSPPKYNKFPKCLILCGHHGFEMSSALAVALFMRQMCNNFISEEIYLKAKTNLEFRVIPTGNPWGTQNNKRRNSNNVDLNRNFPTEWDKADAGARGPSPLSELENQHILAWIEENADAELLINAHDHGDPALAWGATEGFSWTHNMLFNAFKDLGVWYFNNFDKPDSQKDQALTWLGITVSGGLDKHCAQALEFPTILYESPYINHPLLPKGQTAPRLASEEVLKSLIRQIIDRHKYKLILE